MATFITPVDVTPGTADAWIDVDLSAYVPAGTTGVILRFTTTGSPYGYRAVGARQNGSTDTYNGGIFASAQFWTVSGVDANRVCECYIDHLTECDVWLVGCFGSEAVFFENAIAKTLGGIYSWQDVDISGDTGADTAVAAFFDLTGRKGLRKNGSTDDRFGASDDHFAAMVGLDASEICEIIGSSSTGIALLGYMTSGVTMNTNGTDVSIADTSQYVDLAALPEGGIGAIIEIAGGGYASYFNLRKNGTAEDIQKNPAGAGHAWALVEADGSRVIEARITDAALDMFLVGYFANPPDPAITLLNPDHGAIGDSVVITGTTFEAAQGTGGVTFNGVPATVTAWSDTSITVTVPVGATTGDVVVTNNTGDASAAGSTWTLDPPPPAATGGAIPLLGGQLHLLGTDAVLGHPPVRG